MKKFLFGSYYRGDKRIFTYIIAFLVMLGGNLIASVPLVLYGVSSGNMDSAGQMNFEGEDKNLVLFMMLLPFAGMLAGLFLAQKKLHLRDFQSLITPKATIDWQKIFFSFGVWFVLNLLLQGADYLIEPDLVFQFNPLRFFLLIIISVCLIPLQTSLEEIFFRGYMLQGIGNLSVKPIVSLLITSVAFGAMHLANPEVTAMGTGLAMAYYIGFGLILGAITLLDNSLELALGFHAANNLFASVFVTFKSSALQTDALLIDENMDFTRMFFMWLAAVVIYLFIIHKKYKLASLSSLWQNQEREIED
ncbi:MAG: CPBP family intramembrane metalloprotease [Bacteroidia bacterium]|nr:CPBP family intramembrane metalloprotease [Bacteroidia bacterium]